MSETLSSGSISTRLRRIAELARAMPGKALTSLSHAIDVEALHEAYRRTRKDGAVGVDGQTGAHYEANLWENLGSLLERFKSGTYHAPPVRRVHIPKGDGKKTRPIGIPTFEDKVLQRAVAMVLEAIYEQEFHPGSYGFRPGRSAHQALEALRDGLMGVKGGWVIEVDIQSFYDSLDHGHLRNFLDQRVRDGVLRRAIDKWLKAGVLEEGQVTHPELGTPQGGVISPILANVYLHEVLDKWFERDVRPRLRGRAFLVRYADDFVLVFEREDDARRVMEVLPKRFGKYGLKLHPTKTRLINFRKPPKGGGGEGQEAPERLETFDLLGFTHYWGTSREGWRVIKRKTAASRLSRGLKAVARWCRENRHRPIRDQHKELVAKVRGHYAYYGITANARALGRFRHQVERVWRKWLTRRSYDARMAWDRFKVLLQCYPLPPVRVVHSIYRSAAKP